MKHRFVIPRLAPLATALALHTGAQAQLATFDGANNLVTIPAVQVGASVYGPVTLRHQGNYVFTLEGATLQTYAAPPTVVYDVGNNVLKLPAVKVGGETYLDVTLLNTGNYTFTLQGATPLAASVQAEVDAFARDYEALVATALPTSGAARLALADLCWRNNGRTRANSIADYENNLAENLQRSAFVIGRKVQNMQVLALRNLVNADGSARREIDVQWQTVYTDGTQETETSTLISGSSSGTCSTPQTGSKLRSLGNQQLVMTRVRANNLRDERYSITTGNALSPQVTFRREVEFQITDPMGNAKYVIVTGPGPRGSVDGQSFPFSLKLVSPWLLRSAPELASKTGNFLNWLDDDSFQNCRLPVGGVPVAPKVDCVTDGASGTNVGVGYTAVADNAADQTFNAQGWVAGGVYRFDVYNDDGWKTVNGQAGKRPVATYYDTLDRLPFSFVEMTGRYPVLNLGGMSPAQVATNARSATPTPLTISWTAPGVKPAGRQLQMFQAWEFHQGPRLGNLGTLLNPAYRNINRVYPGTTATSSNKIPVTLPLPLQNGKSYTEYNIFYSEPGTFNSVRSRVSFQ